MINASAETIAAIAASLVDLYGPEAFDVAQRQAAANDGMDWSAVVAHLSLREHTLVSPGSSRCATPALAGTRRLTGLEYPGVPSGHRAG